MAMQAVTLATISTIAQVLSVLFIFVFVLALTYFVTKWIGNYQKNRTIATNIEVIEGQRVAPNKFIEIVRVGDKYIVIGVGKEEITMLTEVSEESLIKRDIAEKPLPNFKELLEKATGKKPWNNEK